MDVERLRSNIKELGARAEILLEVVDFENHQDEAISPGFEFIDDGPDWSRAWFADDEDAAQHFIPFAKTRDGSLFAFWVTRKEQQPIVFLASECEGSRVIADDVRAFLSLVAFGSEEYVLDVEYTDQDEEWDGPTLITESHAAFRKWLSEQFDIHPAESPLKIVKKAMVSNDDLMSWIVDWQDRAF